MDEPLVQLTDKYGAVTGATAMLDAFEKELIRHTVYVMLVTADGELLLQKRSAGAPNYPGYWDASAGGHIDEGEAPEQAAYRELEEELGVVDVELRLVDSFYFESEGDGRTYKYYAHVYVGKLPGRELPARLSEEVENVGFYTHTAANSLDKIMPLTKHIVRLL